jgi:hypothetical protein
MPTRNKLISKNLQKKRAFGIYFISEVAETIAKRRKEGFSEVCDQLGDFHRRPVNSVPGEASCSVGPVNRL